MTNTTTTNTATITTTTTTAETARWALAANDAAHATSEAAWRLNHHYTLNADERKKTRQMTTLARLAAGLALHWALTDENASRKAAEDAQWAQGQLEKLELKLWQANEGDTLRKLLD